VTVVAPADMTDELQNELVARGATGFTTFAARGAGRTALREHTTPQDVIRIEVVVANEVADAIVDYLRQDVMPRHRVTACVETVDVLSPDQFAKEPSA
jgi:hypothetical protein